MTQNPEPFRVSKNPEVEKTVYESICAIANDLDTFDERSIIMFKNLLVMAMFNSEEFASAAKRWLTESES